MIYLIFVLIKFTKNESSTCRPPETGSPFDTIGGFLRGELLNPVICGLSSLQNSYYEEGPTYTAGPCDGNCSNSLVVAGSFGNGQERVARADTDITTDGANPVIYENGSSAQYRAGDSVKIGPGFHARSGSRFTALIKGCNTQN